MLTRMNPSFMVPIRSFLSCNCVDNYERANHGPDYDKHMPYTLGIMLLTSSNRAFPPSMLACSSCKSRIGLIVTSMSNIFSTMGNNRLVHKMLKSKVMPRLICSIRMGQPPTHLTLMCRYYQTDHFSQ